MKKLLTVFFWGLTAFGSAAFSDGRYEARGCEACGEKERDCDPVPGNNGEAAGICYFTETPDDGVVEGEATIYSHDDGAVELAKRTAVSRARYLCGRRLNLMPLQAWRVGKYETCSPYGCDVMLKYTSAIRRFQCN